MPRADAAPSRRADAVTTSLTFGGLMTLESREHPVRYSALISNAARRLALAAEATGRMAAEIEVVARAVDHAMRHGGKLLVCGNGGSAAAAQHFAAEFSGKLALDRRPLPAVSL